MTYVPEIQVDAAYYRTRSYDTKKRFSSYWNQINLVMNEQPRRCLEIGIGNGFVSSYLRQRGLSVITCDFDPALKPSVAGNVLQLPFRDRTFDVVLCAEVLGHLPFEHFSEALGEIARVSTAKVVLSLLHRGACISVGLTVPRLIDFHITRQVPFRRPTPVEIPSHYWEIGAPDWPESRIHATFTRFFRIERQFRVVENPFHHFYLLAR